MISGSIARRYASAFFALENDKKNLQTALEELANFKSLLDASQEATALLSNPLFGVSQRKKVLERLTTALNLSALTNTFLKLLIDHERMVYFNEIFYFFSEKVDEALNQVRIRLKVAAPLSEKNQTHLKSLFETKIQKKVILEVLQDPELLGGLLIQIGDEVYDASVRQRLSKMKHQIWQSIV